MILNVLKAKVSVDCEPGIDPRRPWNSEVVDSEGLEAVAYEDGGERGRAEAAGELEPAVGEQPAEEAE